MMINIEDAITHCRQKAEENDCSNPQCAADHRWLAERLEELKELKETTRWRDCREEPPVNLGSVITLADDKCTHEDFVGWYNPIYKEWHNAFGIIYSPKYWMPMPQKGGEV